MKHVNTRVLVIDDEEMVRDNIEEILMPHKYAAEEDDDAMLIASNILFDTPQPVLTPHTSNLPEFMVDKASNGKQGLQHVKEALANNEPYAVIFLDMRMPGWDGLETAMQIRKYDTKAEIIFITAYSDRSIAEIIDKAGQNVGYHCKPYASEEIIQLATKAVTDYSRLRNLEDLIASISSIGLNKYQLTSLLQNILYQVANSVDTDMALLGKLDDDFGYEKLISTGAIEEKVNMEVLISRVKNAHIAPEEVVQFDDMVLARMNNYSVFALLKDPGRLKTEKMYLLKLFVQNAAQAIVNAELTEKLLQKEKLSAVGNAIGMVMHDLRPPIKSLMMITDMMREDNVKSEWVDIMEDCAKQASEIFDDFLAFIKEAPIRKESVNISDVINNVVKLTVTGRNIPHVTIEQNVPDTLIIQGDESKLKRCIANLVNNAINILDQRGKQNAFISITAENDIANNQMRIVVRDSGPGIPEDMLKTLFEPFVTRATVNGTGLGLAIVKQFVIAHCGTITVHNDNGAVFTIYLPV
ncbi:hybrid sensor histidine kinase/response regulator [Ilyomonas limi]|uniref:histidine kinase n=1 Tax=Ilyomonas limi TaxID=2575867 RepID=A0A4V5UVG1_9BACT|nr:hybrid sensor histidine kinase/response regulator [Ilyomonas limi]TKK64723.1 hybrid sensor histidine kinase/response regulator [Ilyomonas limi]